MKEQQDLILKELQEYLDNTCQDKYSKSDIDNTGTILSDNLGKGFNIGNATKYISRYATVGFEKSEQRTDLLKAIHYLIFELIRIKGIDKKHNIPEELFGAGIKLT